MKFFGLLALLFVAGFIKERSEKKKDVKNAAPTNMVYCAPSFDPSKLDENGSAPLLQGLGNLKYKITTSSLKAQAYFNQGLALTYGFNHGEAARSFKEATKYDSTCAMAYWGLAMVLGPNYNAPLNPVSLADINAAIDNAVKYSANATPAERAIINAMRKRFPLQEEKDMKPFYEKYAEGLKAAHHQFPDDVEIATLYADALMNLHPWDLWQKDGNPQPWTPEIVDLLEKTLATNSNHPGAIHYYIHAIEASTFATKALPYADRLSDMMPAAGHMVHMPSHIYIRTGYYHKGVIVNEKASLADSSYIAQCKVQGMVPLVYYPHNLHFLTASAFLEGNSKKAVEAAWAVSRNADRKYINEYVGVQHFYIIPFYVMVHTAKWEEILKLEKPADELKYPVAIWHYARGMAYGAKGDLQQSEKELQQIKTIAADTALKSAIIWGFNSAYDLVNIASYSLEAEIAFHKKQYSVAEELLKKAIEIEDSLHYTEPPDWFFSIRLSLGNVLLKAAKYADAENVYLEDLKTFPENGWALMGLFNSLKAQGKMQEAKAIKQRFDKAWQWSDLKITSSRIY